MLSAYVVHPCPTSGTPPDLQPGTTYYYRVADTSGGNGDDGQKLKDLSYNGKEHSFTVSISSLDDACGMRHNVTR
jgi:hypothetical protein